MNTIEVAIIGCGFWAGFQVAAWKDIPEVKLIAVCDQDYQKALDFQQRFDIPLAFQNVDNLLAQTKPHLIDIITVPETHEILVQKVAAKGIPVICQKPLTSSWGASKSIVKYCEQKHTPLFVHENWRWQAPIRRLKQLLQHGTIGTVFRSRWTFSHNFPVFENQPNLKELPEMIIADLGVHLLDAMRFLLGEARQLYCQTSRVTPDIEGEDVATILLTLENNCQVILEMSFATAQEKPSFPQTIIHLEGEKGVITLREDYEIAVVNDQGRCVEQVPPPLYPWVDPDYAVVQSSIVDCNRQFVQHLQGLKAAENTGLDNLETLRLAYMAYTSAREHRVVHTQNFI